MYFVHITKVYFSNNVSSYGNFPFLFFISMINEVPDLEEKYACRFSSTQTYIKYKKKLCHNSYKVIALEKKYVVILGPQESLNCVREC